MSKKAIVWFRQDLRLKDNPALFHAVEEGYQVIPLYILDDVTSGVRPMGGASRWWLHYSLESLMRDLPLLLKKGKAEDILLKLVEEENVDAVFWNRCYEPFAIHRDTSIKESLQNKVNVQSFNGALIAEPWEIKTGSGDFYKVYTPFWKNLKSKVIPPHPLPAPHPDIAKTKIVSDKLQDMNLLPKHPNWAEGFQKNWTPGESGAVDKLLAFMQDGLLSYKGRRDLMGLQGTSRLSAHLHFGEISPRQIWHAVKAFVVREGVEESEVNIEQFLKEVAWREFAHHLIYHVEDFEKKPFREAFSAFPWVQDEKALQAWQKGQTGFPIVDAAMRQLWQTGWMHNRARMIVASFLTKHLLIHWREGEKWFWDTLVDADLANNVAGWQWVAGCGADAAPYFRIFNPVLQSKKFDASGDYIREFVPELSKLTNAQIHAPYELPKEVLENAGIVLGKTYPNPIIDLKKGRDRALNAYKKMKK